MERTNKRDDIITAVEKRFKRKLFYRLLNQMPRIRFYRVEDGMYRAVVGNINEALVNIRNTTRP